MMSSWIPFRDRVYLASSASAMKGSVIDGDPQRCCLRSTISRRGAWDGLGLGAEPPQATLRLHGAGLSRQRRIHGPGELGDRPGGGRPIRLCAGLGPVDVEPDGRALADAL